LMDIVKKLIEILDGNSEIVIVGLREGEKIQEELWSNQERVLQTKKEGIKALDLIIGNNIPMDYDENPLTDDNAVAEIHRFLMGSKIGV